MSATDYTDLKRHVGHQVVVVEYAKQSVAVECEDCNEVLMDYDDMGTLLCVAQDCNNIQPGDSEYCDEHQGTRE